MSRRGGSGLALICAAVFSACGQGGAGSGPQLSVDVTRITLYYVCDNRFRALNSLPQAVDVTWKVENSGDQGTLTLPPMPADQQYSETFFSTHALGAVALMYGSTRIATAPNQQQVCTPSNFSLVQVAVTPASATMAAGATRQFSAQVTGDSDTSVTWSVQEGAAGGTVDATGLYTAPATPGTYHLVATSHADKSRSATATITVTAAPAQVIVTPNAVTIGVSATQRFSARVTGSADTAVLWSVKEGAAGGSIDVTGLYTAPATQGTYHVVATAHANASWTSTATVTVQPNAPPPTAAVMGRWDPPRTWPLVPIHVVLLEDGRVLSWSRLGIPTLWDPAADTFTQVPSPSWEFCSGNTFLPNGQVLVPGGHIKDDFGLPDVNIFDPATSSWIRQPPMAAGRWYPTAITLADGGIVVVAGAQADGTMNPIPEVRNADGTWRQLTGANFVVAYYPNLFLAPDGRVFMAGSDRHTKFLDTTGAGAWTAGPTAQFGMRDYGTAVMYQPGKIMIAGGGWTPTNTVELLDLNARTPAWRYTSSMNHARRQVVSTVLPDGKVLITGGTSGTGFNDETNAVLSAELWDPATETWTELASEKIPRVYHSTALLMPDGRVMVGGGGEGGNGTVENNVEMFSPPYLFNADGSLAARPSITQAPRLLAYGTSFQIGTPDAASVSRVVLIKNGAVTHAFNHSQVWVPLQFSVSGADTLQVTAPALPATASPGPYMLFILDANGVPSVAQLLKLG